MGLRCIQHCAASRCILQRAARYRAWRCDGLFRGAEAYVEKGDQTQAAALYSRLLEIENAPASIRAAALRGAVLAHGETEGIALLVKALHEDEEALFSAALRVARETGLWR